MDVNIIWHIFITSSIGVALLQYLKAAKWFKWAQYVGTKNANRVLALIISLCSATGVHYVWNAKAGTLMLTGLTLTGIGTHVWHWAQQFITQETIYQMTANKNGNGVVKTP
jgi:hypothetical protein